MQQIIQNGTHAVSIYANRAEGPFTARLYVNCEDGQLGDITLVNAKRASFKSIQAWANRVLGENK